MLSLSHSLTFGPDSAHRSTSSTKWFCVNASSAFGNVITVHIRVSAWCSTAQYRFASGPTYTPVIMRSTWYLVIPSQACGPAGSLLLIDGSLNVIWRNLECWYFRIHFVCVTGLLSRHYDKSKRLPAWHTPHVWAEIPQTWQHTIVNVHESVQEGWPSWH